MKALAALLLTLPALACAATPEQEIDHLLSYLQQSGCDFQRNGSWHSAQDARAHLQKKYQYLQDKQLAGTAEQFIERGASQSSLSGTPYQVRCAGQPVQDSGPWLSAELQRYRAKQ